MPRILSYFLVVQKHAIKRQPVSHKKAGPRAAQPHSGSDSPVEFEKRQVVDQRTVERGEEEARRH